MPHDCTRRGVISGGVAATTALLSAGGLSATTRSARRGALWPQGKGYAKNVEWIGYADLEGKQATQMALHVANGRYYLYTGSFHFGGWNVLDVTDPRRPRYLQWIEAPHSAGTWTMKVQAADGLLLCFNGQAVPFLRGNKWEDPFDNGVHIFDIATDPANPREIAVWRPQEKGGGTHRSFDTAAVMPIFRQAPTASRALSIASSTSRTRPGRLKPAAGGCRTSGWPGAGPVISFPTATLLMGRPISHHHSDRWCSASRTHRRPSFPPHRSRRNSRCRSLKPSRARRDRLRRQVQARGIQWRPSQLGAISVWKPRTNGRRTSALGTRIGLISALRSR